VVFCKWYATYGGTLAVLAACADYDYLCFWKILAADAAFGVFDLGVSDEKGRSKDRPRLCMKY
jgi:hypothetical protein